MSKSAIVSLAPWALSFKRIHMVGDVQLPPGGRMTLDDEEIIAQCAARNTLFVGTDGEGSHARIYIENKDLRVEVGFEDPDGTKDGRVQFILNDKVMFDLFAVKTQKAFEKQCTEACVTEAEKYQIMQYVKKKKINDYAKIKWLESYTGFSSLE